jgi:hypothetical protein
MFCQVKKTTERLEQLQPHHVGPSVARPFEAVPISERSTLKRSKENRMRRLTRIALLSPAATIVTMAWLHAIPSSSAYAQSQSPPPAVSEPTPDVPDQKLDAAAAAIKRIVTVKEGYQQRIESAAPTDRERIADEAKGALEKAITDQGLSLPEYSSILAMARTNPTVHEKIIQRLRPDR